MRLALSLAVALIAGCSAAGPSPSGPPATTGRSVAVAATASPVASSARPSVGPPQVRVDDLANWHDVVGDWTGIQGTAISSRWIAWVGWVPGRDPHLDPASIGIQDRASGLSRTLATAPQPAGAIAFLRITDTWAVWADYTDKSNVTDWQLRAMQLPSGQAKTLLRAPSDATVGDRPEFAVWGDRLVVAARPSGAARHELLLLDLKSGERTTIREAEAGEVFGYPSTDGTRVAAESHVGGVDSILLLSLGSGQGMRVGGPSEPASEPALAGDFLAYKSAPRYVVGPIRLRNLKTGELLDPVPWGSDAPIGSERYVAWQVFDSVGSTGSAPIFVFDPLAGRGYTITPPGSTSFDRFALSGGDLVFRAFAPPPNQSERVRLVTVP